MALGHRRKDLNLLLLDGKMKTTPDDQPSLSYKRIAILEFQSFFRKS
jgi:hypothetical protein